MRFRAWPGSSRHLAGLVVVVTLVPSALLGVLGWRLFADDRDVQVRALQERREQAADLVVGALTRSLTHVEQALDEPSTLATLIGPDDRTDAAAVRFSPGRVESIGGTRLAYVPVTLPLPSPRVELFARGEELEVRNPAAAAAWFRSLARRADPATRPAALMHLARILRTQRDVDSALNTYAEVARLPAIAIANVPSDLLARWARCDLLSSIDRPNVLQAEARALLGDLRAGRWVVTRAVYDVQATDASRWAGEVAMSPSNEERLAAAIDDLWTEWPRLDTAQPRGRRLTAHADEPVLTLWRMRDDEFVAFAATGSFVDREWLAPERAALDRQGLDVTLHASVAAATGPYDTRRSAVDTGLPWVVSVSHRDLDDELARLGARRRLWLAGFAVLAAMTVAGTMVVARAVSSELAVARLQSDFVSAVSHEFRTPLTSLRQITEVLQDDRVPTVERKQRYYGALARQTHRLQRLVEALLDFGRMEAGATPYRLEPVALDELVRSVGIEFQEEAAARNQPVAVHVATVPAVGLVDRAALANALWNLLDNGAKYSPGSDEVSVNLRRESGEVAIEVRDRGIGIPFHERREIFKKFRRGAGARSAGITGTGIGLAVVEHVVAAHRGRITVDSEPGRGSTFTIWLPAAPAGTREATWRAS